MVDDPAFADSFHKNPQFTVMVVRILTADVAQGTNQTPPAGSFRVVEVLRGRWVEPGGEYRYRILSPRSGADGPGWGAMPLHGPRAESELIVFTAVGAQPVPPGSTIILQGPLIVAGASQRKAVAAALVHDSRLLWPLFVVIVLSPVLAALPRHRWLAPAVGIAAYIAYETLMSNAYDIRIDLLVLWPALIVSVAAALKPRR